MKYVYLSPHLDDAVFSCGGIIWEQIQQGNKVEVWTFATMDPGSDPLSPFAQLLHSQWKEIENPSAIRRKEDIRALTSLGCSWKHLDYPDCIYRYDRQTGEPLIKKTEDLFPSNYQIDIPLVYNMIRSLEMQMLAPLLENQQERIVEEPLQFCVPLAVGRHIDHRNTRIAAEHLGRTLFYYADFPYAAKDPDKIMTMVPKGAEAISINLSEKAIAAWQDAIACYTSQISSFWSSLDEMRVAVAEYASQPLTCILWKKLYEKKSRRKHGQA